ncbi:hypothetical protein, partial [Dysosmobacter sp.]|uniref:hypothetical protein n=1 Tax=Dysosmobacter sp. TaxID=2591382 RepID=UPI002F94DD48
FIIKEPSFFAKSISACSIAQFLAKNHFQFAVGARFPVADRRTVCYTDPNIVLKVERRHGP